MNKNNIVAAKHGDINGDGIIDTVCLTADKTPNSPFWQNITLVIQDGRTNQYHRTPLKENAGYNPTLFLGDFTGNKVDDILVVIDTGGSGGTIYAYVFSTIHMRIVQIFDFAAFNQTFNYEVTYRNNFKVDITSYYPRKKYILDLQLKGKEYLSEIYNTEGTLKEPINGWVSPLAGLYPVDFERDGIYELNAFQNIAGRYNADRLGNMENVLKWNGQAFIPYRQNISISGQE